MSDKKIEEFLESAHLKTDAVKADSRIIQEGDVFVAIKGTTQDGHDHIREAIRKGAGTIVCEHIPEGLAGQGKDCRGSIHRTQNRFIVVDDTRKALGSIAKRVFNDPSKKMKVYGVTGTNGKTTTAFLIRNALNAAGIRSGLVSTVFTVTENDTRSRSAMTTPDALTLNRLLSDMSANKKEAAVIEISSHALAQERVYGLGLDSAIFCNISPEHLDFHTNMDVYLKDKSRIFGLLKPGGAGVINADDPVVSGITASADIPFLVSFGISHSADVRGENIRSMPGGTEFDINTCDHGRFHIKTGLIGIHNVYNMLGATASLLFSGISINSVKRGLEDVLPIPGRLESIQSRAPFRVFVDYAHTPNALENVLKCLRDLTEGRLICVFGCGGDRDWTKRPVMGQIAANICDHVILTSDNPRKEDPEEILSQIEKGVLGKNNYSIITVREQAIHKSLEMAAEGDVVIIAGKGHEDYQIIGEDVIHFDDKEVARLLLNAKGY